MCPSCGRPLSACWCKFAQFVRTPHRIVVLQHPREARRALGSVRVLRRVLEHVVVCVGIDFGHDPQVLAARTDPLRRRLLLFPRDSPNRLEPAAARGPLTIFVLDGKWSQVKTLLAANPWLQDLPYVRLAPAGTSIYGVCRQPFPGARCTLEAVADALAAIDADDAIRDVLLRPLRAMVDMHLQSIGGVARPRGYSPLQSD
jgi:DTW domain-containing protein YfiP